MTAKELLSLIQLSGERVRSNEEYLRRIQRELSANEYSYIIERIGETNRRMPTDFQDSHYYDMISGIFQILETTVSEHAILFKGIPINTKPIPIFGTVASRGYNALITPSDEPVIAFNDDLLIFTERILHIYTLEHWLAANKQLTSKIKDILTRNFIDLLVCFFCGVDLTYVLPIEACNADNWNEFEEFNIPEDVILPFDCIYDARYMLFEEDVKSAAYLWVVAHEYAHLLLGHLDSEKKNLVSRYINDISVEEACFQWKDELDADYLAASIVMSSDYSHFKISGIYLALMCLKICGFDQKTEGISTHPPVNQRLENLMEFIDRETRYQIACKNIDTVIVPKFIEFKNFLSHIDAADLTFLNEGEIQKYIYTKYPLSNTRR